MWSFSVHWLWRYHTNRLFSFFFPAVFAENGKLLFKIKKNYFYPWKFHVFGSYKCSFIGPDYFMLNFCAFFKFWGNPAVQVGGSLKACIRQSWRNHYFIWSHHFSLRTPKETTLGVLSILGASLSKRLYLRRSPSWHTLSEHQKQNKM